MIDVPDAAIDAAAKVISGSPFPSGLSLNRGIAMADKKALGFEGTTPWHMEKIND